LNKCETTAA